jgi:hypothetical protein
MVAAAGSWPLLHLDGMSQTDYDVLIEGARVELDHPELQVYMNL